MASRLPLLLAILIAAPLFAAEQDPDTRELFFQIEDTIMVVEFSHDEMLSVSRPKEALRGPHNWQSSVAVLADDSREELP